MSRTREDDMEVGGLHIQGIAEGGVETNLRVPELKLMFDIGMCPPKALNFRRVMISHGHTDHFGGIHYYLSQRGMRKLPRAHIHLPEELVEPLEELLAVWSKIEGFSYDYVLHPSKPGESYELNQTITGHAIRTQHRVPSLAWVIERKTRRLREAYKGLEGREIAELRKQGVQVTDPVIVPVLGVTGDTTIDTFIASERLRTCKVLVHECTSWDDRRGVEVTRGWGHTHVDELIEQLEHFEGETVVLVHRSLRHSRGFAKRVVNERFPPHLREKIRVFGYD